MARRVDPDEIIDQTPRDGFPNGLRYRDVYCLGCHRWRDCYTCVSVHVGLLSGGDDTEQIEDAISAATLDSKCGPSIIVFEDNYNYQLGDRRHER